MNILIIGNGFDLAHRLPTSYTDFLKFFHSVEKMPIFCGTNKEYEERIRFLYKGIIIKHNKTEPTYTKTSLFLCEKRRFFMARTEKGVVTTI